MTSNGQTAAIETDRATVRNGSVVRAFKVKKPASALALLTQKYER